MPHRYFRSPRPHALIHRTQGLTERFESNVSDLNPALWPSYSLELDPVQHLEEILDQDHHKNTHGGGEYMLLAERWSSILYPRITHLVSRKWLSRSHRLWPLGKDPWRRDPSSNWSAIRTCAWKSQTNQDHNSDLDFMRTKKGSHQIKEWIMWQKMSYRNLLNRYSFYNKWLTLFTVLLVKLRKRTLKKKKKRQKPNQLPVTRDSGDGEEKCSLKQYKNSSDGF